MRGIAGRYLAGIGKAGLQRRLRLTVDDINLMAGFGEIIGRGDADDALPRIRTSRSLMLLPRHRLITAR